VGQTFKENERRRDAGGGVEWIQEKRPDSGPKNSEGKKGLVQRVLLGGTTKGIRGSWFALERAVSEQTTEDRKRIP